jgi:hypothetical protein
MDLKEKNEIKAIEKCYKSEVVPIGQISRITDSRDNTRYNDYIYTKSGWQLDASGLFADLEDSEQEDDDAEKETEKDQVTKGEEEEEEEEEEDAKKMAKDDEISLDLTMILKMMKNKQYKVAIKSLQQVVDNEKTVVVETKKGKTVKKVDPSTKPPKLRAVYNIFMSDMLKYTKESDPSIKSADRIAKCVKLWQLMTKEEKDAYGEKVKDRR